jgi:hypothetical protein
MEIKGTNRTANESLAQLAPVGTALTPMTKVVKPVAHWPNRAQSERGPHAARKRRSILQPAPPSKWRQRPRSGCARGAPEGVGGATGGSVLPAGGGKRKVRSKVR